MDKHADTQTDTRMGRAMIKYFLHIYCLLHVYLLNSFLHLWLLIPSQMSPLQMSQCFLSSSMYSLRCISLVAMQKLSLFACCFTQFYLFPFASVDNTPGALSPE